jgi:hypothetical protein
MLTMRKLIMITEGKSTTKSTTKREQVRNLCEKVARERKQLVESYYDQSGKYTAEYDEMYNQLVPTQGKASTLQGEIIRAVSKIYYDYKNNGFGNNWAPVLKFLWKQGMPNDILQYLSNYAAGDTSVDTTEYDHPGANDEIMERMVDWGVKTAMDTDPNLSTGDMWDTRVFDDEFPNLAAYHEQDLQDEEDERAREDEYDDGMDDYDDDPSEFE